MQQPASMPPGVGRRRLRRAVARRRLYSVGVWESVAAPVAVMAAAMGVVLSSPASPAVDAVPVLASAPFGALPGQRVTHTVTLSGSGTLAGARLTFTTTVDLDDVAARAEPGRCAVSPRTVVCDLGDIRLGSGSVAPRVTITGRVRPGAPPGTLVRNRVSIASAQTTTSSAPNASNAYLLPGTPTAPVPSLYESQAAIRPPGRSNRVSTVAAGVVAGVVVIGGLLTGRWLRRRRAHLPEQMPVTTGQPDPIQR